MKNSVLYKLKAFFGKALIVLFETLIEFVDGKVVYGDPYKIENLEPLESHYVEILKELQQVLKNREIPGIDEFFSEQRTLASNRSWKSFPLFVYGIELKDNTILCPKTKDLLLKVKGFSSAMFSILSAEQSIPPHRGIYKGVFRVHLGLVIPHEAEGDCYIM